MPVCDILRARNRSSESMAIAFMRSMAAVLISGIPRDGIFGHAYLSKGHQSQRATFFVQEPRKDGVVQIERDSGIVNGESSSIMLPVRKDNSRELGRCDAKEMVTWFQVAVSH